MSRTKITFLGPVSQERASGSWTFGMLAGPQTPMYLDYDSRLSAVKARNALAKASNMVKVDKNELFVAIQQALMQAGQQDHEEQIAPHTGDQP